RVPSGTVSAVTVTAHESGQRGEKGACESIDASACQVPKECVELLLGNRFSPFFSRSVVGIPSSTVANISQSASQTSGD
ncbi:hypothetical protein OS965_39600, partial [Streptomyces sp. H27-G5]|uniref:hypothetical protein n=1 Tax=Streptomyces sp. H27-G5 TaxID=2996698 RepID=UPI00226E6A15